MMVEELLERLDESSPAHLLQEELTDLLVRAETVREENTGLSGMLRILKLGDWYLVQEQTPDRDVLLRARPTLEEAAAFVEKRLHDYEKMWDG